MAVPDIQIYYFAAQLGKILHWGDLEKRRVAALLVDCLPLCVSDPRCGIFGGC